MQIPFAEVTVKLDAGERLNALALGKVRKFLYATVGFMIGECQGAVAERFADQDKLLRRELCVGVGGMKMQIGVFHILSPPVP